MFIDYDVGHLWNKHCSMGVTTKKKQVLTASCDVKHSTVNIKYYFNSVLWHYSRDDDYHQAEVHYSRSADCPVLK